MPGLTPALPLWALTWLDRSSTLLTWMCTTDYLLILHLLFVCPVDYSLWILTPAHRFDYDVMLSLLLPYHSCVTIHWTFVFYSASAWLLLILSVPYPDTISKRVCTWNQQCKGKPVKSTGFLQPRPVVDRLRQKIPHSSHGKHFALSHLVSNTITWFIPVWP